MELRQQKEAWGAAERVKREAWLAEKTAEVKEMTIKARLGHALLGRAGSPRVWEAGPCPQDIWLWVCCELLQGQVACHAAGFRKAGPCV